MCTTIGSVVATRPPPRRESQDVRAGTGIDDLHVGGELGQHAAPDAAVAEPLRQRAHVQARDA